MRLVLCSFFLDFFSYLTKNVSIKVKNVSFTILMVLSKIRLDWHGLRQQAIFGA